MHAYFPISIIQLTGRKGIIKVLGIFRVDGKRQYIPEIFPLVNLFLRNGIRYLIGSLFYILRILIRQTKFSQDSMHFSIVTTSFTQDINHFSQRILGIVGPFHDTDNGLITILSTFQFVFWDKDIIRQGLVLGNQEGKALCHLKFTNKHPFLGFKNLNHFAFRLSPFTTSKQLNFHAVTIHCMSRVPFSNEYRRPFSIRNK